MKTNKKCYTQKEDLTTRIRRYNDPYHALAHEIVLNEIEDWKLLIKKRAWEIGGFFRKNDAIVSFDELRKFFRSEYCELLLTGTELHGDQILSALEDMLEAEKYGESVKSWQKKQRGYV